MGGATEVEMPQDFTVTLHEVAGFHIQLDTERKLLGMPGVLKLEVYRSFILVNPQPMIFSAEWTIFCSLFLQMEESEGNQTVMEVVGTYFIKLSRSFFRAF